MFERTPRILMLLFIIALGALYFVVQREDRLNITLYPGTGNGKTLVVALPTVAGNGQLYERHGLIEVFRQHRAAADFMTIDIQPTLYVNKRVVNKMKTRVIDPAKSRGYQHIYLLGTSLGGHAAILYAMEHPNDIDGVLLVAPYISDPIVTNVIVRAGGLASWDTCPFYAWGYSCTLWKMFRRYLSDPHRRAATFLGYGAEDRFVRSCHLLAEILPPENVFRAPGGHSWITWHILWEKMVKHLETVKPPGFTLIQ
jgi:hypothetical protein